MSTRKTRQQSGSRNRFEALPVEQGEPEEPVVSQTTGTSSGRHTRGTSQQSNAGLSAADIVTRELETSISIIDSDTHRADYWSIHKTQLRDTLKAALDRVVGLAQLRTAPPAAVPPTRPIPDEDLQTAERSVPASEPARAGTSSPLTVNDVEAVLARTLPTLLQAVLARELKKLHVPQDTPSPHSSTNAPLHRDGDGQCCAGHSHASDSLPPLPTLPQARERDVTISLSRVPRTDAVYARSEGEIKAAVDAVTSRKGTPAILGVKKLANGDLRIRATTEKDKDSLLADTTAWLPAIATNATIARDLYTLEVRAVPTAFDPGAASAIQGIYNANASVFPSSASITSVQWMRELKHQKSSSSLLLVIEGLDVVQNATYSGLSICGRLCDVCPHIPTPVQCYYCQGWGHTITNCARKKSNLPITCARCAGPHATGSCSCPNTPSCSSLRSCSHLVPKCANCGGPHKSFSVDCSARRRATAEVARMPRHARAMAAYSSSLPRNGGAAASDTRRSLSFSGSPRAGSAWRA